MFLIFIFVLSVLLFQPVDRFIKGDDDTAYDTFSPIRKLLIIIGLAVFDIFLLSIYRLILNPTSNNINASIYMGVSLLVLSIILLWMRRLYQNYYVEDRHFFVVNKLFGERTLNFSDIKEVNYFVSYGGGRGLWVRDFNRKKYTIPEGYFNFHKLETYLQLNTTDDFYNKPNKWIPLRENRKEIPVIYFLKYSQVRQRLENRTTSLFNYIFKPKVTKLSQGYLQKPSKFIWVLIIPLILVLLFLIGGFTIEVKRSLLGTSNLDLGTKIFLIITFVVIFKITFTLILTYFNTSYFEDRESAIINTKTDQQNLYFDELQKVVIRNKTLTLYTGENVKGSDFTFSTKLIKPVWLLDYLQKNFVVKHSDYYKMVLERWHPKPINDEEYKRR